MIITWLLFIIVFAPVSWILGYVAAWAVDNFRKGDKAPLYLLLSLMFSLVWVMAVIALAYRML